MAYKAHFCFIRDTGRRSGDGLAMKKKEMQKLIDEMADQINRLSAERKQGNYFVTAGAPVTTEMFVDWQRRQHDPMKAMG